MDASPLYNGTRFAPANASASPVNMPAQSPFEELFKRAEIERSENLENLQNHLIHSYESSLNQQREAASRQIETNAQLAITKALSIPHGQPGSLFDKNGIFKEQDALNLIDSSIAGIDSFSLGFITPTAAQKASTATDSLRHNLSRSLSRAILQQIPLQAKKAFKENYDLAMQKGQTAAAESFAAQAEADGVLSPQEAESFQYKARVTGRMNTLESLAKNRDLPGLLKMYDSNPDELSWEETTFLEENINRIGKALLPTTIAPKRKSSSPDSVDDIFELVRPGMPIDLVNLLDKHHGVFGSKNPTGTQEAESLAPSVAVQMITHYDPAQAENFIRTMAAFGVRVEASSKLATARLKSISQSTSFDPNKAFDNIPQYAFFKQKNVDKVRAYEKELNSTPASEQDPDLKALVSRWHSYEKAERKKAKAYIVGEYTAWLSDQDPKTLTPYQASTKFYNIYDQYVEKIGREGSIPTITQQTQILIDKWKKLTNERAEAQKAIKEGDEKLKEILNKQPESSAVPSDADFADHATETPWSPSHSADLPGFYEGNFIYLPKGHPSIGKTIIISEDKTNNTTKAKALEADVDSPSISRYLEASLLYNHRNSPFNSISIYKNKAVLSHNKDFNTPSLFPDKDPAPGEQPQDATVEETAEEATPASNVVTDDGLVPPSETGEAPLQYVPEDHDRNGNGLPDWLDEDESTASEIETQ